MPGILVDALMARNAKAPAVSPGPLTCLFCWHPQRDSNPCRHLERAPIDPHRVLSSAYAQGRRSAPLHQALLNALDIAE